MMTRMRKLCAGECASLLPIEAFGRSTYYLTRGARDGRANKCLICTRRAIYKYRKTYKLARRQMALARPQPVDKVRDALREGCGTVAAIARKTRLSEELVGDILAELAFELNEAEPLRVNGIAQFRMRGAA